MSFQSPWMLAVLALLPVAVFLYVRSERASRRRRDAFVAPALAAAVSPRRPRWRRHVPVAFMGLALTALVVALARPETTRAVPVEQATVVVATDRSGSMLAEDVSPSRLVAARDAAETFLDAVRDDVRVGAIAFNHEPSVLQSPTRNHDAVRAALRSVTAAGSTATGDALQSALDLIESSRTPGSARPAPAAIVLLSDGRSVRGVDVLRVADNAEEAGIPVHTVALGTASGTIQSENAAGDTVQSPVPPDPATLAQVAEITGGEAFAIEDAAELDQVYEKLGSQLATENRKVEVTGLVAGGALLLLFSGVAASLRFFGRPI